MNKQLRTLGITLLAAGAVAAVAAYVLRDQMARHRRNLFSPRMLRRLAALGHLARETASVDHVLLLRDFIAWEPRGILRERARGVLRRMEEELAAEAPTAA